MEEEKAIIITQEATEEAPTEDTIIEVKNNRSDKEMKKARKAYNRLGVGSIALYYSFQNIALILILAMVFLFTIGYFIVSIPNFQNISTEVPDFAYEIDESYIINILKNNSWLIYSFNAISAIGSALGLAAAGIIFYFIVRRSSVDFEYKKKLRFGEYILFMLSAIGIWGIGVVIGNPVEFFSFGANNIDLEYTELFEVLQKGQLPVVLHAIILAPILEEIIYRKLVIRVIRPFGERPAVFVSALLFALAHGNSGQFFLAFGVGIIFAVVYMRTGKIVYTMLMHATINFIASADSILYFFNIEAKIPLNIALGFIVAAGLAVFFAYFIKKYKELSKPDFEKAHKAVIVNPGIMIVGIGGLLLLLRSDFSNMILNLLISFDPIYLVNIIPSLCSIAVVVLVMTLTARKHKIKEEIQPTEEIQS